MCSLEFREGTGRGCGGRDHDGAVADLDLGARVGMGEEGVGMGGGEQEDVCQRQSLTEARHTMRHSYLSTLSLFFKKNQFEGWSKFFPITAIFGSRLQHSVA